MLRLFTRWAFGLVSVGMLLIATEIAIAQDNAAGELTLTIGSKAPSLDIEHWVSDGNGKFKPVTQFDPGRVYVVEFWATWCGPCIGSMPHLVETQHKYSAGNVQIISISDEELPVVEAFLKREVRGAAGPAKADADDTDADAEKPAAEPQTYAMLTSAYCLTTDPDQSVSDDYMRAAGQNGIPCCFIVGKQGDIEWIGHPMSMDEPLASVVNDSWDRDAYLAEFKKSQERQALISKLSRLARAGDSEAAMKAIEDARVAAADDPQLSATLDRLELTIMLTPILAKVKSGDTSAAVAAIDELLQTTTPSKKSQLIGIKFSVLMQGAQYASAAGALRDLIQVENVDSAMLNQIAWSIYEAAMKDDEFSKELIVAATEVAEKAVSLKPDKGSVIDTLARLNHLQGDLDRAIELQTKALEHAGQSADEIKTFLDQLKQEKASQ